MTTVRRTTQVAQVLIDEPLLTIVAVVPDGRAIVLQGTGDAIWHRLPSADEPALHVDELIASLATDAGVSPAAIENDVGAFLVTLAAEGLIERRESHSESNA